MVGLISVVYAIKEVTKQGPNFIIAGTTLVIGLIAITLFIMRQRKVQQPLINNRTR